MSYGGIVIITNQWLVEFCTKNGGYTKKQFEAIGLKWKPLKGWKNKVIGREISEDDKFIFELESAASVYSK